VTVRTGQARGIEQVSLKGFRSKGVNFFFSLIAIVGCLHALAMLSVESYRILESQREIKRLSADVAVLEGEVALLNDVIAHKNDEVFLEQLARCYGFAYPEEARYQTMLADVNEVVFGTPLCP
jgi:cell division protein FtsB